MDCSRIMNANKQLYCTLYNENPYVLLNSDNVILAAGNLLEICLLVERSGNYYDNCVIDIRRHDLHLNDNTLVGEKKPAKGLTRFKYRVGKGPEMKGDFADVPALQEYIQKTYGSVSYSYTI